MAPTIIKKPLIEIDPELRRAAEEMIASEGQVIVHCLIRATTFSSVFIRIWQTTYLYPKGSDRKSELVHFENVTLAPEWSRVPAGSAAIFSLFFSSLPKSCTVFDLVEEIAQPGGFIVKNIPRNDSDVYYVQF